MSSQSPSLFSSYAAFDIVVYDFRGALRPIHHCAFPPSCLVCHRGRRLLQFFPPFILRSAWPTFFYSTSIRSYLAVEGASQGDEKGFSISNIYHLGDLRNPPQKAEAIFDTILGTSYKTTQGWSSCFKDSKNVLYEILANRAWKALLARAAESAQVWWICQNWLCYLKSLNLASAT